MPRSKTRWKRPLCPFCICGVKSGRPPSCQLSPCGSSVHKHKGQSAVLIFEQKRKQDGRSGVTRCHSPPPRWGSGAFWAVPKQTVAAHFSDCARWWQLTHAVIKTSQQLERSRHAEGGGGRRQDGDPVFRRRPSPSDPHLSYWSRAKAPPHTAGSGTLQCARLGRCGTALERAYGQQERQLVSPRPACAPSRLERCTCRPSSREAASRLQP